MGYGLWIIHAPTNSDTLVSHNNITTNNSNNNNTMTKLSNARAIVEASSAVFGASLLIQLLQNAQLNDTALGQLDEAATTEAALGAAKAFVAELERASRAAAGANANGEKGGETTGAVVVARDESRLDLRLPLPRARPPSRMVRRSGRPIESKRERPGESPRLRTKARPMSF